MIARDGCHKPQLPGLPTQWRSKFGDQAIACLVMIFLTTRAADVVQPRRHLDECAPGFLLCPVFLNPGKPVYELGRQRGNVSRVLKIGVEERCPGSQSV